MCFSLAINYDMENAGHNFSVRLQRAAQTHSQLFAIPTSQEPGHNTSPASSCISMDLQITRPWLLLCRISTI